MTEFEKKIDEISALPQARALRAAVVAAVDAYIQFLKDNGLKCYIQFVQSTDDTTESCVTQFQSWNDWRAKH